MSISADRSQRSLEVTVVGEVSRTYVLGNVFFKKHLKSVVEDDGEKCCHITTSIEGMPTIFIYP